MENVDPNPNNPSSEHSNLSDFTEGVKDFYTGKFPAMISKFFRDPLNGIREIIEKASSQGVMNSLILYGSVFILFLVSSFIFNKNVGFSGALQSGLTPVLLMFMISLVSFGLKSISGKPNFKNELLTGALCGIPLLFLLALGLVLKIFTGESILNFISFMGGTLTSFIFLGIFVYFFVMIVNVLQQSLLAAKTKKTFAWYIAPVGILLAMFVTIKIMSNLFA